MIPIRGVVDVDRLVRSGAHARRVAGMAADAGAFVAAQSWCAGVRRVLLGACEPPGLGVFLVELSRAPVNASDRWLWCVVGGQPPAYFVLDRARTATRAIRVYCELMDEWVEAVRAGRSLASVYPVRATATAATATRLARRLRWLRKRNDAGIADASMVRGARVRALPRVAVGALVTDNHGRDCIVSAPTACPDDDWLRCQRDRRVRRHRRAVWWKLLPLSGGAIAAPAPLLRTPRKATPMQIAIAWRNANEAARAILVAGCGKPPY